MTLAQAQAAAADLRTALLDNGVPRVSIELQPGVGPKADPWGVSPFKRVLSHHVASYPPGTPGLGIVKGGRGGTNPLTGPLANCYGGFDLTARIITLGWANHPGEGGPWTVPGWGTVPRNNGRPYLIGWEFEGGYLDYTDEMHDFMARCAAGSLDWLGTLPGNPGPAPLECHDEHLGWAGPRKPDRKGYTTASGRARIAAVRGVHPAPTSTEDPEMKLIQSDGRGIALIGPGYFKPLNEEEAGVAAGALGAPFMGNDRQFDVLRQVALGGITISSTTADLNAAVAKLADVDAADVDEVALAQILAPLLNGTTVEQIADALRSVLRDGVGA